VYPATEIDLHLDHICAAQRPNPTALGGTFQALDVRHQPAPSTNANLAMRASRGLVVAGKADESVGASGEVDLPQRAVAECADDCYRRPADPVDVCPQRITQFGCAACHTIPGIKGAKGNIGPPLIRFGDRTYVAGMLRNTPPNLVRWIREPQAVVPGNAMPNMGVSEADARDIAAYLYTLR